jgi:WD40 repeat protein
MGKWFVSGGADWLINVFNADTGQISKTLRGHSDVITRVEIAGDRVASASMDRTVKLWSLTEGTCLGTYGLHDCVVFGVRFDNEKKLKSRIFEFCIKSVVLS